MRSFDLSFFRVRCCDLERLDDVVCLCRMLKMDSLSLASLRSSSWLAGWVESVIEVVGREFSSSSSGGSSDGVSGVGSGGGEVGRYVIVRSRYPFELVCGSAKVGFDF